MAGFDQDEFFISVDTNKKYTYSLIDEYYDCP